MLYRPLKRLREPAREGVFNDTSALPVSLA